ncbi:MAG: efflux RND transporter periplasmic adaptor subunit [Candidatus Sumerlaeia bacterium]
MADSIKHELDKLRIDKRRRRNGRGVRPLWIVALIAAAVVGAWYWHKANAAVAVKVAKAEAIAAARAAEGTPVLTASGYVIPRHVIEVSSKIIGRVKDMLVARGDRVKAGDVLIRLEDGDLQAQLRAAEARLASADAKLAEMRAGSRPQEVQAARAAVNSAEATLENTKLEFERKQKLAGSRVISQQELDLARMAFRVAEANLRSARENLNLIETWPRREQLDAAEADQRQAVANLEYAKTQIDEAVIRAPVDGTILEKLADKGELVTNVNYGGERGAKSSVVSMANLKDLQVELDVNENDLPHVRMGQACEVRVDSAPGRLFTGEVDEIAPQADRQKGTVQVKVRLINPSDQVLPDVSAHVTFLKKNDGKNSPGGARVLVPASAIVRGSGTSVWIAAGGRAVSRAVKVGAETPRGAEVIEGLSGGELVITSPLDQMTTGTKVKMQ